MPRPLTFQPGQAIADIAKLFWRKGYEGTSMQDIEAATGLKKQSLYRLFTDKRGMYLAALEHYGAFEVRDGSYLIVEGLSAAQRFAHFFKSIIDHVVATGDRSGCFLCNASADQAQLDDRARDQVEAMMTRLSGLFEAALEASSPYDHDADLRRRTAQALLSGYIGLRILIKANQPEEVLRDAASGLVRLIAEE